MTSGLRPLRWRLAAAIVGAGLIMAWVWMSGGTTHLIQIDYRWGGTFLEGSQVEIDGVVAGTLQRYGRSNYTTGFEVDAGEHVVRILRDGCTATPRTVRLGGDAGRRATLMADVEEGYDCRVLMR